jgi:hypothetical protein
MTSKATICKEFVDRRFVAERVETTCSYRTGLLARFAKLEREMDDGMGAVEDAGSLSQALLPSSSKFTHNISEYFVFLGVAHDDDLVIEDLLTPSLVSMESLSNSSVYGISRLYNTEKEARNIPESLHHPHPRPAFEIEFRL